jgi:protein-disulfide isomerase
VKLAKAVMIWLACALSASPSLAARDWTRTVAATPAGGYLIGNPAAPVKVVEYFSLTCPHCRHFAETGMAPLKSGYVGNGKVSIELRNFVLNAPDLTASLLMRCGTPVQAVRLFDAAFAEQDKLFAGAATLGKDAIDRINTVPIEQRPVALAREAAIDKWFVAKGLPEKRAAECLADQKRQQQLVDLREHAANDEKVPGTPAFIVNGALIDGTGWDDLEPAIKKALGG